MIRLTDFYLIGDVHEYVVVKKCGGEIDFTTCKPTFPFDSFIKGI